MLHIVQLIKLNYFFLNFFYTVVMNFVLTLSEKNLLNYLLIITDKFSKKVILISEKKYIYSKELSSVIFKYFNKKN